MMNKYLITKLWPYYILVPILNKSFNCMMLNQRFWKLDPGLVNPVQKIFQYGKWFINVSQPTMTAYLPPMICLPVRRSWYPRRCTYYTEYKTVRGIDVRNGSIVECRCLVLKYRLARSFTEDPVTGIDRKNERLHIARRGKCAHHTLGDGDGLKAVQYVREHANRWISIPDRTWIYGISPRWYVDDVCGIQ